MSEPAAVLGVVMAGGENRRYGSHKALETVGGERILDRALAALAGAVPRSVVVANDLATYGELQAPVRPDLRPGLGALGGIYTAVRWAAGEGYEAALAVACDMPFLETGLLRALVRRAAPDAISIPASEGPRGMEPLCAAYGVEAAGAIERALDRGDRAIVSFFDELELHVLSLEEVSSFGEPERMFMNVNRPEDRERAQELLKGGMP